MTLKVEEDCKAHTSKKLKAVRQHLVFTEDQNTQLRAKLKAVQGTVDHLRWTADQFEIRNSNLSVEISSYQCAAKMSEDKLEALTITSEEEEEADEEEWPDWLEEHIQFGDCDPNIFDDM